MAAEAVVTSLPSVVLTQENNYNSSDFLYKERRRESKTCFEQSLVWDVAADDDEWVEPEITTAKSAGHRKVTLPLTTTQAKRRSDQRPAEGTKLPKQNVNRSGFFNPASLESSHRNPNQLARSGFPSMPVIPKRQRSFTVASLMSDEQIDTVQGKLFRENLGLTYRQNKEAKKLEYDNMASSQTLQDAHDQIGNLIAKIEKRNKYIRERNKKEGDIIHEVEASRRERDEKLLEYKLILKRMKEALAIKDKTVEDAESERTQAETTYQKHLKENTDLMRKIEAKEKQIKQLKEKTEKAKKWKENVRS